MRLTLVWILLLFVVPSATAQPSFPKRIALNGDWELLVDAEGKFHADQLPADGWRSVRVPLSLQAQFPDLRDFQGTAWYRRTFIAPALKKGERLLLRFGAVDYIAEVFVNGQPVGQHEGGYTPFSLDATSAIQSGANTLLVRVTDPPSGEDQKQIPHGKQTWYVQTSGIWQDVWLEQRPSYYIEQAQALTEGSTLRGFRVQIAHADHIPAGAQATLEVVAPGGRSTGRSVALTNAAEQTLTFPISDARLWSPEDPALYSFRIRLPNGDRAEDRFGFRTIETRNGRLYLNGKPYYMIGALDQDFYPEGIYSPPSKDYIIGEMRRARQLGLNTLRCHIKVPDPRYLEAADETGMLIWYESPNWDELTDKAKRRARQTLEEMMARDWNHPAIIIQTIINESWGIDLHKADQRAWLAEMTAFARGRLPNRLVVDNSPCCGNFHLASDLADYHQYNSIPDSVVAWDKWVADFATRPAWLWSKYDDARPSGQEPLIVSEFGNWGLPELPKDLPWWFGRGMGKTTDEISSPAGVFDRFQQYGLDRVFSSFNELASGTQQHQWEQLRHEIETIRLQPSVQGYVITEFTDLNWEGNGLLTMWREPKHFQSLLAELQQPVVVLAVPDKPNYRPEETVRLAISVANYSPEPLRDVEIAANNRLHLDSVPVGGVVPAGMLQLTAPSQPTTSGPAHASGNFIPVFLRDHSGTRNVRNLSLAVIGQVEHGAAAVRVAGGDDPARRRFSERLVANGYQVGATGVLLTSKWDEAAEQFSAAGGSVIVLADSADAFSAGPIKTVARTGDLAGDWISNFNWFDDTRPPFERVAVQRIAGWETKNIVPRYLLAGLSPEQYRDVLSGFFLGWIRQPHALALQARHGKGRVIVCTWALGGQYGEDAYATALLDALIAYINSPSFDARLEI